jgi:hypothetical protein
MLSNVLVQKSVLYGYTTRRNNIGEICPPCKLRHLSYDRKYIEKKRCEYYAHHNIIMVVIDDGCQIINDKDFRLQI